MKISYPKNDPVLIKHLLRHLVRYAFSPLTGRALWTEDGEYDLPLGCASRIIRIKFADDIEGETANTVGVLLRAREL